MSEGSTTPDLVEVVTDRFEAVTAAVN